MRKYERDLRNLIAKCGAEIVRKAGSGHFVIRRPDGGLVTAASSPSDHRALRNIEKHLTRMGVA